MPKIDGKQLTIEWMGREVVVYYRRLGNRKYPWRYGGAFVENGRIAVRKESIADSREDAEREWRNFYFLLTGEEVPDCV